MLRNVKSFSTKQTAHALHPWSERVKQKALSRHQGLVALMQAVSPRVTWGESLCHLFNRHSQRGTATSEPRKHFEDEKCYLLAKYPYQQRSSTVSYNQNESYIKFFYSQSSYILSKLGKKNKSVMMELIPALPVSAYFTKQKVHRPLTNENCTQSLQQERCTTNSELWAKKHS